MEHDGSAVALCCSRLRLPVVRAGGWGCVEVCVCVCVCVDALAAHVC